MVLATTDLVGDLLALWEWQDGAACAGIDVAVRDRIFFPGRGESAEPAKAICATCPVVVECGNFAVERVIREGVWGGMSERQRRRERVQRKREGRGMERLPNVDVEPAPAWVDPRFKTLWKKRRAPRRATFGSGSAESRRIARAIAAGAQQQAS